MIFLASRSSNRLFWLTRPSRRVGHFSLTTRMLAYIPRAAFRKPRSGCLSNIFRNDGPDCQYLQGANYRVFTQASRLKVACLPSMWITSVWPVTRAERALVAQQFQ